MINLWGLWGVVGICGASRTACPLCARGLVLVPALQPPTLADVNSLVRLQPSDSLHSTSGPCHFKVRLGCAPEAEVKARVVRREIASASPDTGVLRQPACRQFH